MDSGFSLINSAIFVCRPSSAVDVPEILICGYNTEAKSCQLIYFFLAKLLACDHQEENKIVFSGAGLRDLSGFPGTSELYKMALSIRCSPASLAKGIFYE